MSGIGHSGGPSFEAGYGFRKLACGKARKSLLRTLPIEINTLARYVARLQDWA